jgi:hypothetical protein
MHARHRSRSPKLFPYFAVTVSSTMARPATTATSLKPMRALQFAPSLDVVTVMSGKIQPRTIRRQKSAMTAMMQRMMHAHQTVESPPVETGF